MVDVLLAHAYFLKYDSKQTQKMRPYAPLATLYAASHLRAHGYSVALFDAMLADGEHEFEIAIKHYRPRVVALYEDSFNFLSKMCLSRMREAACTMSAAARRFGATVIAAGSDVSDQPAVYFGHGVQYALVGEADHTLRELLDYLSQKARGEDQTRDARHEMRDTSDQGAVLTQNSKLKTQTLLPLDIPGLALPDPGSPGGVHYTAKRANERHLDTLPFPAWDLLDVERYRARWQAAHGYFSLNMVSTRGCPFHCNWCAKPIWGQRYAMRSPANVAEELALIKRTLRPDHLWFADDIFGLRPQWVADFGREVAARDAAIPFMIQSRVDLMTDQAVAGLKQAGCVEVWMGAESGSQHVLDAMDKGTDVEEIRTARARLKAAGIKACFFIQFGYPGETFHDIMSTVQMVRDTLPDNIGVSVSYPLPGTKFHELVKQQLGTKTHWVDSDDLAMMFHGTYQSPFYRKLHQVLHRDLELRQRLDDRQKTNNESDSVLFAELDHLNADWLELGQLEVQQRSEMPTVIAKPYERLPAPDLSREWN